MKKSDIDLKSILTEGHVVKEIKEDMLHMATTQRLSTNFKKENMTVKSYAYLPDTYSLPLRIDFTIKIDSPGFYLFLGNGHLNFGTPWSDNRRIDDIVHPTYKPRFFHNHIPMNKFVHISVIYDLKAMEIRINGQERFYSEKEKYMKSALFKEQNEQGFRIKIASAKLTNLVIKSIQITESDHLTDMVQGATDLPKAIIRNEAVKEGQKPTFETCIARLPKPIQNEIIKTDHFLRSLKPMTFKRVIEKHGHKITYIASDHGFSYAIYPSNDIMYHSLNWYILTNKKPELWGRKDDKMMATLNKLRETSPEFADRMFINLKECIACHPSCSVKTVYTYNETSKCTCHGSMLFKMSIADFEDVRHFIHTANGL
ncbi:hypothetical protein HZI73_22135 [Vallitalea pronyensis]|uniref:Uncharacterized protein n=1 Tax=Vallitalea pronyensis TaxID=1348613 RepID=A0A8J8MNU5_9FIRM|nr:hypothetical protein [Vallitalea pronyensis]QUI24832.1 hypothetical protein HZI73_22135 [Vallitalea pronyensis]